MTGYRDHLSWVAIVAAFLLAACDGQLGAGSDAEVPADGLDGGAAMDGGWGMGQPDAAADDDAGTDPEPDGGVSTELDAGSDPDPEPEPDAGSEPPPPTGPLVLHMAANGNDSRDGTSRSRAVRTLTRVHEIISDLRPGRDVEVRIQPGTYRGQRVRWTYTMPDHKIRFVTAASDNTRPVFDGCSSSGSCPGGTWFTLVSSSGRPTNLEFRYLRVTRYQTAMSFNGSRATRSTSNGSNRIFGMYFDRIGNGYNSSLAYSTAAVRLVNSDDNEIINNHFVDVINVSRGALIHAIYAAHGSDRNRIERNRFQRSTGDPVRIRDYSNGNIIRDNRFIKVGTAAGYTDWYCDHDTRSDCTSPNPECPSWDNQFRDNTLDGKWNCTTLGVFEYFQDDSASGCSRPTSSSRRLRTSGNTQTSRPCSMN